MSNYKHFSKINILVRVIALIFHSALCLVRMRAAAHIQNQVCEV